MEFGDYQNGKRKNFWRYKRKIYDIDLGTESSIVVNGDSLELLNKVPDHSIALIFNGSTISFH